MGLDINTAHENGKNECHQSSTVKKKVWLSNDLLRCTIFYVILCLSDFMEAKKFRNSSGFLIASSMFVHRDG